MSDRAVLVDICDDEMALENDVISHSLMHSHGVDSVSLRIIEPSATRRMPSPHNRWHKRVNAQGEVMSL